MWPFEQASASETEKRLERALASLPVAYREVLLLVAVERLEPGEAARVLDLKPDALRQRLARARSMLAERLARAESDVEARVARRIEKRAHSLLEQERRHLEHPGVRRVARLYSRAIEPALVAGACAIYLYSTFSAVFALLN